MLLRNYSINIATLRSTGGLAVRSSLAPWSSSHNMYLSEASYPLTASSPSGTEAPYSFVLAPKGGEMSSTTSVFGNGDVSGSLTLGKSFTANLSWDGNLSWWLGLLTALASSLSGSWDLAWSLGLSLSMIADLSWSWDLSGSLGLQVPFFANLSWFGEVTGNLKWNASLSATIYVNTWQASTEELKDAIWNALGSQFMTPGTMAYELLNGSGGGGWLTLAEIEGSTILAKEASVKTAIALSA